MSNTGTASETKYKFDLMFGDRKIAEAQGILDQIENSDFDERLKETARGYFSSFKKLVESEDKLIRFYADNITPSAMNNGNFLNDNEILHDIRITDEFEKFKTSVLEASSRFQQRIEAISKTAELLIKNLTTEQV